MQGGSYWTQPARARRILSRTSVSESAKAASHDRYTPTAVRSSGVTGAGKPAPSGTRGASGTGADRAGGQVSGRTGGGGGLADQLAQLESANDTASAASNRARR
jgi:hypothetical protein